MSAAPTPTTVAPTTVAPTTVAPTTVAPTTGAPTTASGTLIDFDGSRLDPARWQVYDAFATNGTSRWSPDMVRVVDGELRITGIGRDPTGAANISGGVCWCRGTGVQTYGRWEVRARFEAGAGFGLAVLLWPQSERWPEDGEVDLVETPTGTKQTAEATVHWGTTAEPKQDSARLAGDFTQWHVYAVEWRAGGVKVTVDSAVLYDSTGSARPPDTPRTPMGLALQQEPGPFGQNWVPAPTPATPAQVVMHVDWVKLYR
jgi:endo-1,3-1,4-beta-glycanase ExoK